MSVINTNTKALVAQESMRSSNLNLSSAMERLSTGKKINSAKDDAAGLAISNRMTAQIRGIAKATGNVNDAISMAQTAEGAIGNVTDILQRMRELAVQSGTGTMNNSDRSNIQLEVSQLKQQIDTIANTTNHNNIKLLDGSAQKIVVQTGVNTNDRMDMGFGSIKTKDIGLGSRAALTSIGGARTADTNFDAFSAGQLLINGVSVGESLAADDKNSPVTAAASSAIAKAAAINKVADISGVYAKANTNTVSGAAMTATALSGTITVNGVSTTSFSTGTDAALNRKLTVNAINAISGQTGVVATDTEDNETGVTLSAADGRNVVVAFSTLTSATTGVAAASTNVASYSLYKLDGGDINISFKDAATTNDVENQTGLRVGSYKSDTATVTTYKRTSPAAATPPTSADQGLLNGNSLIINGVAIGAALTTDDTASQGANGGPLSSVSSSSAIAIAAAINRKSQMTGVTASAAPNTIRGEGFTSTSTTSASVYLNGVTLNVNTISRDGAIDSFNSVSGQTGVVASAFGAGIQLTAADGRNINIGTSATVASLGLTGITVGAAATSAAAITFLSQVTLSSDNAFDVKAGSNGVSNLEKLGFRQGTFGATENGLKVNQVDVSTLAGANLAITAIDAAINTASAMQAKSGAINNRLDSVIENLAESSKNMQASRSRIMDTDYATETTNLAKQQIVSQAATAMLAQANQSSQSVLSLLK
jgi:flagellin